MHSSHLQAELISEKAMSPADCLCTRHLPVKLSVHKPALNRYCHCTSYYKPFSSRSKSVHKPSPSRSFVQYTSHLPVEAVSPSEAVTVELIVEAASAQAVSEQKLSVHKPSADFLRCREAVCAQAISQHKLSVHKLAPTAQAVCVTASSCITQALSAQDVCVQCTSRLL